MNPTLNSIRPDSIAFNYTRSQSHQQQIIFKKREKSKGRQHRAYVGHRGHTSIEAYEIEGTNKRKKIQTKRQKEIICHSPSYP